MYARRRLAYSFLYEAAAMFRQPLPSWRSQDVDARHQYLDRAIAQLEDERLKEQVNAAPFGPVSSLIEDHVAGSRA